MMKKKKRGSGRADNDEDNGFAAWGGYMAAKKAKLEDQFLVQAGKGESAETNIFKGIAIFVNGYTVPTADELRRIMMVHGGLYHHYESHRTTHIIASNLPDVKVKRLKDPKIVKPSWIVDSVAAGRLLDYRKYLLYSNQTKSQPHLLFSTGGGNYAVVGEQIKKVDQQQPRSSEECESCVDEPEKLSSAQENCQKLADDTCDMERNVVGSDYGCPENRDEFSSESGNPVCGSKGEDCAKNSSEDVRGSHLTAVEPKFLSEFYNNSRLHHLSTMGAMFKDYIAKLRTEGRKSFPGRKRLSEWKETQMGGRTKNCEDDGLDDLMRDSFDDKRNGLSVEGLRTIMHVDMDCFFVSVGLRHRPELRELPVAVTHAKGNPGSVRSGANRNFEKEFYQQRFQNRMKQKQGSSVTEIEIERKSRLDEVSDMDSLAEIASCNYEARKAGVKNGMFLGAALKLCPNLKTIPYDFEGYKEVSYKLYDILASYTLDIEAVSCDEMYVDCTKLLKETKATVLEFSTFLREEIKATTGCTASAGFGNNPLQARLATKKAKPNGQFYLQFADVERFMQDIRVEDLPGVGYSLAYRLRAEGITTCRDIQRLSLASLQKKFGSKTGQALHKHSRGEDNRALDVCHQRKSVSAEVNYGIRFTVQSEAETFLKQLSEEVSSRMKAVQVRGCLVTLKLMVRAQDAPIETAKFMGHGACDNMSRSSSLAVATDDPDIIHREAVALERQLKVPPSDLRGMGIQIGRLNSVRSSVKNNVLKQFLAQAKSSCEKNILEGAKDKLPSLDQNSHKQSEKEYASDADYIFPNNESSLKESEIKKNCEVRMSKSELTTIVKQKLNEGLRRLSSASGGVFDIFSESTPKETYIPLTVPQISSLQVPVMTVPQARKLLRAWFKSGVDPQECDILMFANYTQQLVSARRLEDLDVLFSLIHRSLLKMECKWKAAYKTIVKYTQEMMRRVYGAELRVPEL